MDKDENDYWLLIEVVCAICNRIIGSVEPGEDPEVLIRKHVALRHKKDSR